jgi:large subunit ribosomal protein L30
VRIRGTINVPTPVRETLKRLNLKRRYNATLLQDTPIVRGMLQKAKDWIAWSEVSKDLVAELLMKRGRKTGWKRLDEEFLKELNLSSFEELAEKLIKGEIKLNKLKGVKPYFALNPPRGGFPKPVRKSYKEGGVLGKNPELPEIVKRMI